MKNAVKKVAILLAAAFIIGSTFAASALPAEAKGLRQYDYERTAGQVSFASQVNSPYMPDAGQEAGEAHSGTTAILHTPMFGDNEAIYFWMLGVLGAAAGILVLFLNDMGKNRKI